MSSKKGFYPTKRKVSFNDWQSISENKQKPFDLSAPIAFNDEVLKTHTSWAQKFSDDWINSVANIGSGASILQHSEWLNQRLSYAECALLANDSIINNAVGKITNEILRKKGIITLSIQDKELENDLIAKIETRMQELDFWNVIRKAINTSLVYGGALIFIDTNSADLSLPLYDKKEILATNKIQGLKVVEPYLCGVANVNTTNPLNSDFMKPREWFVSGAGKLHKSRIETLIMFECPDMIKPLYNYLGISLCQFMKSYVMSADVARQSLNDIFLRFRTIIIKSDLAKINAEQAKERVKYINNQRNNAGTLLLTADEEYNETITTLSGLDKIVAQMQENIAVSARMPAVKLLGLTPSGFNATGDFDLASYYDEIMSIQNAIIKPLIDKLLRLICLELELDVMPSFEFDKLSSENKISEAQYNNVETQTITNLIQSGVITQEQGLDYLKGKDILDNIEFLADSEGLDFDLENNAEFKDI